MGPVSGIGGTRVLVAALVAVFISCGGAKSRHHHAAPTTDDDVAPTSYSLELELDPSKEGYSGQIVIELRVAKPIGTIWLHGAGITVRSATLTTDGNTQQATVVEKTADELLGFRFPQRVKPGNATLHIAFDASYYTDRAVLRAPELPDHLFTHFEHTRARRAFPCFDEPRFAAPWTIALTVPREHTAFSNAAERGSEQLDGSRKRVAFEPTGPLPPHLVAFATGPFIVIERGAEPVPMRFIKPRGDGDSLGYAADEAWILEAAPPLLSATADYVGTDIPIEKNDFIWAPWLSNEAAGGPGLIFVGDSIVSGFSFQDHSERALAGAFARLWFGNMVALQSWSDIWLNESIADWLASTIVQRKKGTTRSKQNDLLYWRQSLLRRDGVAAATPVRLRLGSGDDVAESWAKDDGATQAVAKGTYLLDDLERRVGADEMRDVIRNYVAQHSGRTATTAALLDVVSQGLGDAAAEHLRAFVEQPGLPIIDATLLCDDGVAVEVVQERFARLGEAMTHSTWPLDICIRHPSGVDCGRVDGETGRIPLSTADCPAWFLPNAGEQGLYYYRLSNDDLDRLVSVREQLTDVELTGLVLNISANLDAGTLDAGVALDHLQDLAESDLTAVTVAVTELVDYIAGRAVPHDYRDELAAYIQALYSDRARGLGLTSVDGESPGDAGLRHRLVEFVGILGADPVLGKEARSLVDELLADQGTVPLTSAQLAFQIAASDSDDTLIESFADVLSGTGGFVARAAVLGAMGSFTDARAAEQMLGSLADDADTRLRWLPVYLMMISDTTRELGLSFYVTHYEQLEEQLPATTVLRRLLDHRGFVDMSGFYAHQGSAGLCSSDEVDAALAVLDSGLSREAAREAREAEAFVRAEALHCAAFRQRHTASAVAFLSQ